MARKAARCLVGGPGPDSIQPWAQQRWGLWQTSEHWASLTFFFFLYPYCLCRDMNSNTQKLKQMEWLAVLSSFSHVSLQYLSCKWQVWFVIYFFPTFLFLGGFERCGSLWLHKTNKVLAHSGRKGADSYLISPVGAPLQTSSIHSPVSLRQKGPCSSFRNMKVM